MRARRLLRFAVPVLLVLGAVAHWQYWYAPHARAGRPTAGGPAGSLCATAGYDACLWLAYPHQNLGALAAAVGDLDAYLAAAGRQGGFTPPAVFSFGPFAAPPAREMALAVDRDGKRFAAVAQLYPTMALVSRLAGWVAGNPWLAGGEVRVGAEPARVRWQGRTWRLESLAAQPPAGEGVPAQGEALARLWLRQGLGAVPPGEYQLSETAGGLAVRGEASWAPEEAFQPLALEDLAALGLDLRAGGRAAALFAGEKLAVPRAAVLFRDAAKRWRLPGESLLTLGGRKMPAGEAGGWGYVTYERSTLERAAPLAARLGALSATADQPLAYGLWLQPQEAHATARQIAEILEQIPLLGEKEARRFRDYATLLAPLAAFRRCAVATGSQPGELRLVLEP